MFLFNKSSFLDDFVPIKGDDLGMLPDDMHTIFYWVPPPPSPADVYNTNTLVISFDYLKMFCNELLNLPPPPPIFGRMLDEGSLSNHFPL